MKKAITLIMLVCLVFTALSGCVSVEPQNNGGAQAGLAEETGANTEKANVTNANTAGAVTEPSATETERETSPAQTERVTEAVTGNETETVTEAETEEQTAAETEKQTEEITTHPKETEPAVTERPPEPVTEAPTEAVTEPPVEPEKTVYADMDSFDLVLMNYLRSPEMGNYMISPLSFRYALGMLTAGASGQTLAELKDALGISDLNELEDFLKQFNSFAEGFNESAKYETDLKEIRALQSANSVWKRNNIPRDFKEDYKMHLQMYEAEMYEFDLSDVIKRVNDWADKKTNGMIPELLPQGYSTDNLAVILMNALYFKSFFLESFETGGKENFLTQTNETVEKDYIFNEGEFMYYKDGETELLTVPMRGNTAITFVLGSYENLKEKLSRAKRTAAMVKIPKFEVETSLENKELVSFLYDCGARSVFGMNADLSAMIDWEIYVTDIIQKTKICLNETGVEAAAVTAIITRDKGMGSDDKVHFTLDRPFSFFIHTTESEWTSEKNVIMFEGEIVE